MSFQACIRSVVLAIILGAPPTVAFAMAAGDDPKPSETQTPERITKQVVLHAASPSEVASIIQNTVGIGAVASERSGVVILTGPPRAIELAMDQIALLESAAQGRVDELTKKKDAEQEQQRHAERLALEERKAINEAASITVDFAGGTVAEYLAAVRKASGFDNIVVGDQSITKLQLPAVKVKRVTGAAAVLLLQSLRFGADGRSVALNVQLIPGDPEGVGIEADPVMVIDIANAADVRAVNPPLQTEVFDLAVYQKVEPERLEALLDAITTAAGMNGKSGDFQLKLHKATGLLIARGTPNDLELVVRTIKAFTGQSRSTQEQSKPESSTPTKQ